MEADLISCYSKELTDAVWLMFEEKEREREGLPPTEQQMLNPFRDLIENAVIQAIHEELAQLQSNGWHKDYNSKTEELVQEVFRMPPPTLAPLMNTDTAYIIKWRLKVYRCVCSPYVTFPSEPYLHRPYGQCPYCKRRTL